MATQIDVSTSTLNLNNHTFSGWSDDGDALSVPSITGVNVRRGGDGKTTFFGTGERGGPVVVKLLPTSDSTRFLMNIVSAQVLGGSFTFNGVIQNNTTGSQTLLSNGKLTVYPLGQTVGKGDAANMEFTFEFESVIPDYSGADFS